MLTALQQRRSVERRVHHRLTMADLAAITCLACAPVVGIVGFSVTETADPAIPWVVGVVMTGVTTLMVPLVRWWMKRVDKQTAVAVAASIRREEREDALHESFRGSVAALDSILHELREMNEHHKQIDRNREAAVKDIVTKIDNLPCKGSQP